MEDSGVSWLSKHLCFLVRGHLEVRLKQRHICDRERLGGKVGSSEGRERMLGEPGKRGLMSSGGSGEREDGKMSFKGNLGVAFSMNTLAGPEGQPCQHWVRCGLATTLLCDHGKCTLCLRAPVSSSLISREYIPSQPTPPKKSSVS